ncbi:MAG TPA: ketoacyl-ACP synthase III [Gemmataceae bacterium]|nr:ketoacyl-ACP synthase III [Gemmataceae bacterium]
MAQHSAVVATAMKGNCSCELPFVRRPIKIAGMGAYLPPHRLPSAQLEQELALAPGWAEQMVGVRERRRRSAGQTAVQMAALAARDALDQAGVEAEDVDLVISASVCRQQFIPCTAAFIQRELDLPEGRSFCFDVDATCLSFLVALHTAAPLVESGVYRTVLICSSEIPSHMMQAREPETVVLFGDAAAAAVLTAAGPGESSALEGSAFATFSSGAELTELPGGGYLHHPSDPNTTPEMNQFHMRGRPVLKQALRVMGPFLDAFFARLGWDRMEIDWVVPHQASRLGVSQCTERWGFRPEQLVLNLATRGNCVAASIPLALAEAVHAGDVRRGQRVLLVGTGAGLSLGAAALTF